jgi:hypothetical protein
LAPVGYYESRLAKSILKSAADKVYLIRAEAPKVLKEYTAKVVDEFKEKFGKMLIIDGEESADFLDAMEVYKVYSKIIEAEKLIDPNTEFIIDVTSTTKEGTIAATLIAQLYNIKISYTFPQKKLSWLNSPNMDMEKFKTETEIERLDPGGKYLQYNLKALPLGEEEIMILEKMAQKEYDSIRSLVNAIGKEAQRATPGATKKYWGRIVRELQDIGLVELSGERYKRPTLSERGRKLVEGIKEGREVVKKKKKSYDASA